MEFLLDPPLTDDLRDRIVALWVEVTNAGGAVGFLAPTDSSAVRPLAEATFAGIESGLDRLLIQVDGEELTGCCSSPTTGSGSRRTGGCSSGSW